MSTFTTAEVAAQLRLSPRKVRELAAEVGVGMDAKGRAGYRFEQSDVDAIKAHLRPTPVPDRRRARRGAA